ncbi:hypothetical protein ACWDKQ_35570, partial [Saccharopolyspora sp. NPDC000995]
MEQQKQGKKAKNAREYQARKAEAVEFADLQRKKQLLREEGRDLAPEKAKRLEWLEPRVEKQRQKKKKENARQFQARKAEAAELADLQRKKQLLREEGRDLAPEKAKRLEWLEQKVEKQRQKHRAHDRNSKRAKKDADADEFAKLKKLEEQGQLNPEQRTKLNLHREIGKDEKEVARLAKEVSRLKEKDAKIEALKALPQSGANEAKLSALRAKVAESAGSAELLKNTRERLKTNRAALKSVQARGEAGSGRIAGVEAGGQQDEQQDALEPSEGSESAGADRDERDAWSDGGFDFGVSVDEVMGDSGGEGQAAASLSDLDEDWQTGLEASREPDAAMQAEWEGESGEGLDDAVQERVEGRKAEAERVAELQGRRQLAREEGKELTEAEADELAWLEQRVAQRKQNKKEDKARQYQVRKETAERIAELQGRRQLAREEGKELTEAEADELAWLEQRVAQRKQNKKEENARQYQARKAEADWVAELQGRRQLALQEGRDLAPEEAEELAQLEPKMEQQKQKHRAAVNNSRRAKKGAAADEYAKLEELEKQRRLNSEQQTELNLWRKIKNEEKEEKWLAKRVTKLKKEAAEVQALEALPRSADIEANLGALQERVAGLAGFAEKLKKTRDRLKKDRAELKSVQAQKETGPKKIAGLGVSGQQNEQDAMASTEGSESAGAGRDERDAWSDGGFDFGVSVDEVMGDSGGEGQAAASLSDLDEDWQTGLEASREPDAAMRAESERERESGEGLGEVVEEGVEGVAGDGGRVAQLRESLEQAESYLASFEALPGWDEVVRADSALLPMFDQGLRADWEQARGRVEALRAELAGMVVGDEGELAGGQVDELGEVVEEGVGGVAGDGGRVAQLRESLEQAESYLASFEALPGWDEVVRADPALLPMFDQGLRADWEQARGRVEALRAELAGMVGDEGEPAGEQVGESGVQVGEWGVGRVAGFVPAAIAGLAELTGRMDRHLRAMPPEFNP